MFALLMCALSLSAYMRTVLESLSQFIYDLPSLKDAPFRLIPHFPGSLPAYGAHGPRTKPHVGLRSTAPLLEYNTIQYSLL
ncbi:hypothetical protein VN97_g5657 [Penicillium thymicola]|uniref:Secreted protein n=1 Tax=Penicillium thymicola TaxID=293382 RepID=A0AAI9TIZ1_PENTH|nr:hypothetical protein VN97_g5657 [Penicillium thymicola]